VPHVGCTFEQVDRAVQQEIAVEAEQAVCWHPVLAVCWQLLVAWQHW
jgi:hypothetical protein